MGARVKERMGATPTINCYATANGEFATAVFSCMTIPFTLRVRGGNEALVRMLAQRAWTRLNRVDRVFSPFRSDSYTTAFNRGDLRGLVEEPWFYEVYARCLFAADETDGFFQPFADGRFDPVGLVKGWAIERVFREVAADALGVGSVTAAALSGGGDMQVAVAPGVPFTWGVGIEAPQGLVRGDGNGRELVGTVRLAHGAVATSGISKRGEHIAYPQGRAPGPSDDVVQATVIADSLTEADVWATTAVAAGRSRFAALVSAEPTVRSCVLVTRDGATYRVECARRAPAGGPPMDVHA